MSVDKDTNRSIYDNFFSTAAHFYTNVKKSRWCLIYEGKMAKSSKDKHYL